LKKIPINIEAEQHVLAGLACNKIKTDLVLIDDFYDQRHKLIYQAVSNLKNYLPVNSEQVWKVLDNNGLTAEVGTEIYIIEVLDRIVISKAQADYWLKELKEASNKRKLKTFYQQGIEDITDKNLGAEDSLTKLSELISETSYQLISKGLDIISARDIQAEEYDKVESIWGDLLYPSSIIQINSEPGLGKTTFMYNLLLQGALNKEFLGIKFSKQINSLYVDVETPSWLRKRKLDSICDTELPDNFYFIDSLNLKSQEQSLVKTINEYSIDVLVLDTQSRVFQQEDENNNAQANTVLSELRNICQETEVCIVLVHHLGKDTGNSGVYSGRGASAVAGAVEIVVNLSSLDSEVLKLEVVKSKVNNDYFVMGIKKIGDDRFEAHEINDDRSFTTKIKIQDEILQLSPGIYETAKIQSILQARDYSKASITRALSGLVQSCKIGKVKRGEYEIYGDKAECTPKHKNEAISEFELDNNTISF